MKSLDPKRYNIVIVGAGVVGEATGKGLAKKGHQVSYVDVNPKRIAQLRQHNLQAMTAREVDWSQPDIVMLTVSTPTVNNRIILDHITSAVVDVGRGLRRNEKFAAIVIRSTVPPTTTDRYLTPLLERESGKRAGVDFGVAMNPEFLRQRCHEQDFARPWITVLGASDPKTSKMLHELYTPFGGLIINYCTPTEAEMIKYANNIYNAVKISYFNEMYEICEGLGIDGNLVGAVVARSAESIWNPLYGTRGGVPYGGACLPKDTTAFMQFCQEWGFDHIILQAVIQVNEKLAARVSAATSADEIEDILGTRLPYKHNGTTVQIKTDDHSNGRVKRLGDGLQPADIIENAPVHIR
jgi:UDPglucose 6-dehydrogenase